MCDTRWTRHEIGTGAMPTFGRRLLADRYDRLRLQNAGSTAAHSSSPNHWATCQMLYAISIQQQPQCHQNHHSHNEMKQNSFLSNYETQSFERFSFKSSIHLTPGQGYDSQKLVFQFWNSKLHTSINMYIRKKCRTVLSDVHCLHHLVQSAAMYTVHIQHRSIHITQVKPSH